MPTLYELLGVKAPTMVDGFAQDPMDGVSMVYTFADANAPTHKKTQYFEVNASRGIFYDGWYACTFGPLVPWDTAGSTAMFSDWNAANDVWELYNLTTDFSQATNLAANEGRRLQQLKDLFIEQARQNKALPIGASLWLRLHPEDRMKTPYTSWQFDPTTTRMPEFTAPGLGRESTHVTIDADVPQNASGVLYALGGASGGVTLYMDQGKLVYEYNMMIIERYIACSKEKLSPGKRQIEVHTTIARPGAPAEVVLNVDGKEVARMAVKRTVPAAFTASETFDVGIDLGSPVSLDYFDKAPFRFNGKIRTVHVRNTDAPRK